MKWFYFTSIAVGVAIMGCSKSAAPPPQAQQGGLHMTSVPPGAEPIVFSIILTNAQPPPMRAVIGIYKTMKFEWHKVANDGSETVVRGVVPTEIFEGVMAEWRTMSGRTSVDPTREGAVYVGPAEGKKPPQVQRLLDYVSK